MECVSTWPLLQRNKIEDSQINIAVQTIADAPVPEGGVAVDDSPIKLEDEAPKPQEVKAEPANLGSTKSDADKSQADVKSEGAEPTDFPISTNSINGVTPMTVDEPNLESERGRVSERHESQAMKLKRLATKVFVA